MESQDGSWRDRLGNATETTSCGHIRNVPEYLRNSQAMKPHGITRVYQKYTEAYGIPIIGDFVTKTMFYHLFNCHHFMGKRLNCKKLWIIMCGLSIFYYIIFLHFSLKRSTESCFTASMLHPALHACWQKGHQECVLQALWQSSDHQATPEPQGSTRVRTPTRSIRCCTIPCIGGNTCHTCGKCR